MVGMMQARLYVKSHTNPGSSIMPQEQNKNIFPLY